MYIELAIFALFVFAYSLVAGRVERAAASGPIVFVVSGFLMGPMVSRGLTVLCRAPNYGSLQI